MGTHLQELKNLLAEIADIQDSAAVLEWDQQTYMPAAGSARRAEQVATLQKFSHRLLTSTDLRTCLDAAETEVEDLCPSDDDRALVDVTRRDLEDALKLPEDLVTERARHSALAMEVWATARSQNDFSLFAPVLKKTINLEKQVAECRGYADHPYDALIHAYEPGARTTDLRVMFAELREKLVPLVRKIKEKGEGAARLPAQEYSTERQNAVARRMAALIGYDLERGRIDQTVHPFATSFSRHDARITVRFHAQDPSGAIFAALHEAGHAMYEQGMIEAFERSPLRGGASLGVHESQSRLWENLVGRSRTFWEAHFPIVREEFPEQLGSMEVETFYNSINRVEPSFIRVDADEVTYNLHVLLRFEMELDLIDGTLNVVDAPEAWNSRMQAHLGVTPPDNRRGILQDVHWSLGAIGYFPTYTIGNLLSCQLWEAALQSHPSISESIEHGDYSPLLAWLREHIHRHGRKFLPADLVRRSTGKPLTADAFVKYLEAKYGG